MNFTEYHNQEIDPELMNDHKALSLNEFWAGIAFVGALLAIVMFCSVLSLS